jgi:RimJ/RimL family protein N-acetyltransferase
MEQISFEKELVLKRFDSDLSPEILFNFIEKNKKHLTDFNWVHNINNQKDILNTLNHFETKRKDGFSIQYGAYIDKTLISIVTYDYIGEEKVEVSYYIDKDFCGKGYATDVLRLTEGEIFKSNINKVVLRADVLNIASQKVAIKNDYTKEGVFKDDHIYIDGRSPKYGDIIYYGKLKSEWEKK